jgi:glycerophosphoryl diester phosphodiesterase
MDRARRRSTRQAVSVALICALAVMMSVLVAVPADAAGIYLKRGSRGANVKTLETRLHTLGLLSRAAVDRRYRYATWLAVRKFQRSQKLRVTGNTNTTTWNRVATAYHVAITPPPPPPPPPTWSAPGWAPPKVTAHRGGGAERPENTLDAFRNAVAVGADVVEFDVRSTSDHRLVMLHDVALDRTTNCTGIVYELTFEQVRACQTDGNGQPVPTLDEVLDYLAPLDVDIAPEIKAYGVDLDDDEVAALVAAVKDRNLEGRTFLQSFQPGVFALVNASEPALTTVYLSHAVIPVSALTDHGADIASVNMNALTRANVDVYHANHRQIWTWTAYTVAELQKAWSLGADSVGTDIPKQALSFYGRS